MKKKYLSIGVLFIFTVFRLLAVELTIEMNDFSSAIELVNISSDTPVDVGEPVKMKYVLDVVPGTYLLSAYDDDDNLNGTIELLVSDEEKQLFKLCTVVAYVMNEHWEFETDYTVSYSAASREGAVRITSLGDAKNDKTPTGTSPSFLMLIGDTYLVRFLPSEERIEEGYVFSLASATVSVGSVRAARECMLGQEFTFFAPEEASVFLGMKRGSTHYVPFDEISPVNVEIDEGGEAIYTYFLADNTTYNYRVKQTGGLTHTGKIGFNSGKLNELVITSEQMNSASPKYINHTLGDNGMKNVADIFLNINRKGLLRLPDPEVKKDSFQIVNLRTWQITDDDSNNYYVEPDFSYTILNENFEPSNSVVTIDEKGVLRPVDKGTAIVQVTYDAAYCWQYNKIDGFGGQNADGPFYGGALWSAIWPENTGTFIVTVGEEEDSTMMPNMEVDMNLSERLEEGNEVDAEHDIFYYMEGQPGYYYTFKPQGVVKVELANPDIETNPNIAIYNGFSDSNVTKTDTTFTALLTYGRNIIRMTSATGKMTYQVLSAKPVSYEMTNVSRPDETNFYPGDKVKVQFKGFYHPANKLAGIYNMSTYLFYNGVPNGTSLILGPGQYTFAGNPAAQAFTLDVPVNFTDSVLYLKNGALQVKGYGSKPSVHRGIDLVGGRNPNFTAGVHINFWGSIPDVGIPIMAVTDGVKFEGVPEGVKIFVMTQSGDTVFSNPEGAYLGMPEEYNYEVLAHDYKAVLGKFTIEKGQGIKTIQVVMDKILADDNGWDGANISFPEQVSVEEFNTIGGEFEGMENYYKIKNGYELAWLSYFVNKTKQNSKTNAVLVRDLDLKDFNWTPIGSDPATYDGVFRGNQKTIKGLKINSTESKQALFGYTLGIILSDLTIEGNISSTADRVAAFVAEMRYYSTVKNCHNKATVSGKNKVGGIVGESYHYPHVGQPITVIENCTNQGDISGNEYVGGIGGLLKILTHKIKKNQIFSSLSNSGNIKSEKGISGGIAGVVIGIDFENVINTGEVKSEVVNLTRTANVNIGGIVGVGEKAVITNAYNSGNVVSGGSILGSGGVVNNAFTVAGNYKEADEAIVKTNEEFASGQIAWQLGDAFGQKVGEEGFPKLSGDEVYKVKYTNNLDAQVDSLYTNETLPIIEKDGFEAKWYTAPEGDLVTEVTEDKTLYLFYNKQETSVSILTKDTIWVYPNPFVDFVVVQLSSTCEVLVFDLSGRLMFSKKMPAGESKIDTSELVKGTYILKLGTKTIKLIK